MAWIGKGRGSLEQTLAPSPTVLDDVMAWIGEGRVSREQRPSPTPTVLDDVRHGWMGKGVVRDWFHLSHSLE